MKKIIAIAVLSTIATAPAVAADFYAGIKLGNANHNINVSGYTESVGAAGLFAGYSFSRNFSAEIELIDTGVLGANSNSSIRTGGFGLSAIAFFPVNEQLSLFGKLGVTKLKEEDPAAAKSSQRSAVTYGLGGQYDFNQTFAGRLAWDHYKYGGVVENNTTWNEGNVNMFSVSALIKF